jgi:hypothetical protein
LWWRWVRDTLVKLHVAVGGTRHGRGSEACGGLDVMTEGAGAVWRPRKSASDCWLSAGRRVLKAFDLKCQWEALKMFEC